MLGKVLSLDEVLGASNTSLIIMTKMKKQKWKAQSTPMIFMSAILMRLQDVISNSYERVHAWPGHSYN